MGWKRISYGGQRVEGFWEYSNPGDEIKGRFLGSFQTPARDQFPAQDVLILLQKSGEKIGVNVKKALECVLELERGTGVHIRYLGRKNLKAGNWFHNFDVRMWDQDQKEDDELSPLEQESKANAPEGPVPPSMQGNDFASDWERGEGEAPRGFGAAEPDDATPADKQTPQGDPGESWT